MVMTMQLYFQLFSTDLMEPFAKILIKFDCKTRNKLDSNSDEGSNTLIVFLVPLLIPDSLNDFLLRYLD